MRAAAGAVAVLLLAGCSETPDSGPPVFGYGQSAPVQVDVDGMRLPIEATVRVIEPGSLQGMEDAGLTLPEDATGKQPFYVRVAFTNTTGRAFTAPVAQQFRPLQSDGRYAQRLAVVSAERFATCDNPVPPATFATIGGSAEGCFVVLVDPGTTVVRVEWTFADRSTLAVWKPRT